MTDFHLDLNSDWNTLLSFLPEGWEAKARELGALSRTRNFASPEVLLRVLMIHFSGGHSLRTTSALAREAGLAKVSDVAMLKRLNRSGEWFLWMAQQMRSQWFPAFLASPLKNKYNMRLIDGTTIQEPGARGATWKIHYSLSLNDMRCDEVHVTSPKVGESFTNFKIQKNDIIFGDRGYCKSRGVAYVHEHDADVILRLAWMTPLYSSDGKRICLLERLRCLKEGELGEWDVNILHDEVLLPCRVCAIKKNENAIAKEHKRILRRACVMHKKTREETFEYAKYVIVLTTLDDSFSCRDILELYRMRWQVELAFKRLKSLLGLGHLRKSDPQGAKAWIHGKLFLAVLIETFIRAGESFFPWGYAIMEKTEEPLA